MIISQASTQVKVNFTAPTDNGGAPIDHYIISFFDIPTQSYIEQILVCNGADSTVITNMQCVAEMSAIVATYSYSPGDLL